MPGFGCGPMPHAAVRFNSCNHPEHVADLRPAHAASQRSVVISKTKVVSCAAGSPFERSRAWDVWSQSGGSGPTGDVTVYMTPMTIFTIAPGGVIEGDIYLVPGDASAARSVVYALHQQLTGPDIVAPIGKVDVPVANAALGGSGAQVAGWAFAATAIAAVTVYVDGTAKGTATLGAARPDVAAAYPNLAPPNSGWTYALAYIRQFG